jgi:hypothetical protein
MNKALGTLQLLSFFFVLVCVAKLAFANPSSCERKVYATKTNPPTYWTAANGNCPVVPCDPPCSDDSVTTANGTYLICSCGGSQTGCTTGYQDDGFGSPYVGGSVICITYCEIPWCPFSEWLDAGTNWQLWCGDC